MLQYFASRFLLRHHPFRYGTETTTLERAKMRLQLGLQKARLASLYMSFAIYGRMIYQALFVESRNRVQRWD